MNGQGNESNTNLNDSMKKDPSLSRLREGS